MLLLYYICAACAFAQAPDHAREKRWADEITPAILVGDAVYLAQKSGHKFLAIYTANAKARDLMGPVLGAERTEAAIRRLNELERAGDVAELVRSCLVAR